MRLDEYLTEFLMPIYPSEIEKQKQNFYLLFIGGTAFGDGTKLTEAELHKDFNGRLPAAPNYVFVCEELNAQVEK